MAPKTSLARPYIPAKYPTPRRASTRASAAPSLARVARSTVHPCAWKYQGGAAG